MDIIAHDVQGLQTVWDGVGDCVVGRGGGEKQWSVESGEGETKFFNKVRVRWFGGRKNPSFQEKTRVRGCGNKISIMRDFYRRTDGITI